MCGDVVAFASSVGSIGVSARGRGGQIRHAVAGGIGDDRADCVNAVCKADWKPLKIQNWI